MRRAAPRPDLHAWRRTLTPYDAQMRDFRRGLLGGFAAARRCCCCWRWRCCCAGRCRRCDAWRAQIRAVERGEREQLDERWPSGAGTAWWPTSTRCCSAERTRIARYRDTLGNLAHSLKTPLAVLRASLRAQGARCARRSNEQVDRMTRDRRAPAAARGHQRRRQRRAACGGRAAHRAGPAQRTC